MTQEEIKAVIKQIKGKGKADRQYFSISEYAQINVYFDEKGSPIIKGNGTIKTLSPARICQRLDSGEIRLTHNANGISGDFIDSWKYPPGLSRRGAKKKPKKLSASELEKYTRQVVKEFCEKEVANDKLNEYLENKYQPLRFQIKREFFTQTVLAGIKTYNKN